jgi:Glycosyltransferase family 9 (heptosyltransferase)
MTCMRRGDFAAAWRISDAILEARRGSPEGCSSWPRHLQFVWNGDAVAGKRVLVRCYHGLGDTIQFVRLLAPLREHARETILWVQPVLCELLRSVRGVDRILPLHDGAPECDYDVDVELMELPHVLRLTPARIPRRVPYIYVTPADQPAPAAGTRRVGIAWRSGDWLRERSIPAKLLAPLAGVAAVQWFSLQYPAQPAPLALTDLACDDIESMAARMSMLDLVICVDTMVAHLAGALGIPVWTLLHDECDWRWMRERSDSPWYPTMRLFRQRESGNWRDVIDEVSRALA